MAHNADPAVHLQARTRGGTAQRANSSATSRNAECAAGAALCGVIRRAVGWPLQPRSLGRERVSRSPNSGREVPANGSAIADRKHCKLANGERLA